MMLAWEIFAGALVVIGTGFCLIAAIGILRFEDVFMRMHATTKAGTLGTGLIMLAAAITADGLGGTARALGIIVFLLLTAPVAAHMIARAAYRAGAPLSKRTVCDERREVAEVEKLAAE
ncbi:MAG: monovalent cation/H(+) antiporter subunit G [Pseudomonadota bacterium]